MKIPLSEKMNIIHANNGDILLNNQRIVMTPSSGIGTLHKNLIETIGSQRAKTFLIRYGWNLGESDAVFLMNKMEGATLSDLIMEGPKQHMLMGHAMIEGKIIHLDPSNNHFHIEGTWKNSYAAQEYMGLFGFSKESVCHILVGYASGFTSKVLGSTVIYRETSCEAMGKCSCHWVGKTLTDWNGEVDGELGFFQENNLIHELENAYEQIVVEKDNLGKTYDFHKKLTEHVMLGRDLHSIVDMVHDFLNIPIIILNKNLHSLARAGLTEQEVGKFHRFFSTWLDDQKKLNKEKKWPNEPNFDQSFIHTQVLTIAENQEFLMSPIIVRQEVAGYCVFISNGVEIEEIHRMILERTSAASSYYLLNKQIAFETEQRSRGRFLEQILNQQLTKAEIVKWGHYAGIDLEDSFYVAVINQIFRKSNLLTEAQVEFNDRLISELSSYFTKKKVRFLIGYRLNHVVILIQAKFINKEPEDVFGFFEEVLGHCQSMYRGKKFKIGISLSSDCIETAIHQYEEALAAFQMASGQKQVLSFDALGAVGILIQAGNESVIKRFIDNMLGVLLDYDRKKGTEAIKTVYVYLSKGGNLELTASELALSISGLRYRLQRIESMLGFEIRDPQLNYQLYLAIQLLIVYGETDMEL